MFLLKCVVGVNHQRAKNNCKMKKNRENNRKTKKKFDERSEKRFCNARLCFVTSYEGLNALK